MLMRSRRHLHVQLELWCYHIAVGALSCQDQARAALFHKGLMIVHDWRGPGEQSMSTVGYKGREPHDAAFLLSGLGLFFRTVNDNGPNLAQEHATKLE